MTNSADKLDFIPEFSEPWLGRFSSDEKVDLEQRLKKGIDAQEHQGAFFELFLHEFFSRLGCFLEVHPEIVADRTRPDFRVRYREKYFYLEGTNVGKMEGPFTRNNNEKKAIEDLGKLTSPHFDVLLDSKGDLKKTLSGHDVCLPFKKLLDDHQPEEVRRLIGQSGRKAAPSETIRHDGWYLRGWLHPTDPRSGVGGECRQIKLHPASAKRTTVVPPLRKALKDKAGKYPSLDAPLVVAVNARDPYYNGKSNDVDILSGDEQILYIENDSDWSSEVTRKDNGLWSRNQYRKIDAVAMFWGIDDLNVSRSSACLYVNPWKTDTVLPDVLFRLPHAKVRDDVWEWSDGEGIGQILGLL